MPSATATVLAEPADLVSVRARDGQALGLEIGLATVRQRVLILGVE